VKPITRDELSLGNFEGGALVIIDEAWRYFPSGQKQANVPETLREFLALHGHKTGPKGEPFDIVLMCQAVDQLAGWVRGSGKGDGLIDQLVWITASRASGLTIRRRRRWEGGSLEGSPVEDAGFSIDESIAVMYKSTDTQATQQATQGPTATVWKNKWVIAAGIFVITVVPVALYSGGRLYDKFKHRDNPSAAVRGISAPQAPSRSKPSALLPKSSAETFTLPSPAQELIWRLSAVMDFGNSKTMRSIAVLTN